MLLDVEEGGRITFTAHIQAAVRRQGMQLCVVGGGGRGRRRRKPTEYIGDCILDCPIVIVIDYPIKKKDDKLLGTDT